MTTITIKTRGIGLIYQKDGKWKEIFPFGKCHEVKFRYKKDGESNGTPPKSWAGKNRKISITVSKAASQTGEGDGFDNFFDITENLAHKNGIKKTDKWNEKGVLMEIDDAEFSVDEMTLSHYNLHREDDGFIKELGEIGHSGKAVIELQPGGFVKISLTEDGNEIEFKTFNFDDGSHTVFFDNDCDLPDERSTSDFQMIYDIIEDKDPNHKNRKFKIDRHPKDKPKKDKSVENKEILSTNPAAGEEGLPCHKAVIKDAASSDLP
ncbi:hypothetical protein BH20ACI4_BH20ACI4_25880 [soil metagenome]